MRPEHNLSSTRHHFRLVAQWLDTVRRGDRPLLKQHVSHGDALVPSAKFLKDTDALGKQTVRGEADVVYVAVGHGLVVNLLTLLVAELAAKHPVHIRKELAGSVLVAAGPRDLQCRPHRKRPVMTHGVAHLSFNVEGLADHLTIQTELLL